MNKPVVIIYGLIFFSLLFFVVLLVANKRPRTNGGIRSCSGSDVNRLHNQGFFFFFLSFVGFVSIYCLVKWVNFVLNKCSSNIANFSLLLTNETHNTKQYIYFFFHFSPFDVYPFECLHLLIFLSYLSEFTVHRLFFLVLLKIHSHHCIA